MKEINIKELNESAVSLFDKRWALITAGNESSWNTMTASWGALGELWNKDVCFCFIRPQRYTYEFTEKEDFFTLSFFGEEYRKALVYCGKNSGRDVDKASETGLTPKAVDGSMSFEEAEIVLVCKKLAFQDINPEGFIDRTVDSTCYPDKDYHRMYIGEIVKCYVK
ncbi:MAG: flavin reductase [Clostridia bacterium]|nr:flavin reductase [Clostridia bacterium]